MYGRDYWPFSQSWLILKAKGSLAQIPPKGCLNGASPNEGALEGGLVSISTAATACPTAAACIVSLARDPIGWFPPIVACLRGVRQAISVSQMPDTSPNDGSGCRPGLPRERWRSVHLSPPLGEPRARVAISRMPKGRTRLCPAQGPPGLVWRSSRPGRIMPQLAGRRLRR